MYTNCKVVEERKKKKESNLAFDNASFVTLRYYMYRSALGEQKRGGHKLGLCLHIEKHQSLLDMPCLAYK